MQTSCVIGVKEKNDIFIVSDAGNINQIISSLLIENVLRFPWIGKLLVFRRHLKHYKWIS